jgi:allantoinase
MQFDMAIQGDLVLPSGVVRGGWLAIREGTVAGIFSHRERPEARRMLDAQGKWVLPGGIDAHVHSGSNKDRPEGLTNMTRSAAAGGLTTVIDMPFDAETGPVTNVPRLKAKIERIAREAVIDVALYGSITKRGGTEQILPLADGGVCGYKLSTFEYDPERFPRIPDDELIKAFELFPRAGRPVSFHAENDEIVSALIETMRAEGASRPEAHCLSHPPIAETTAIAKLLELARLHPLQLHIAHLSVPFGYEMVNHYKALGVDCTTETNVMYLVFVQEQMAQLKGTGKVNPPLRPREVMEQLWEKLFAGDIDFIISDHAPWSAEQKSNANIFDDRPGIPGVETLLTLFYSEGVARRGLDMQSFARLTAGAPARRFGLYPAKGALWIGADADVAILNPATVWRYDASKSFSTGKLTPVDGMELTGKVEATLVRGELVYEDGEVLAAEGYGRFVAPG